MTDTEVLASPAPPRSDHWRWLAASFAVVAVAALAFAAFVLVRDDGSVTRAGTPGMMPMMSMDADAMRAQCVAMHGDADWCAQMVDLLADHPGASTMPMRP
ncbi:MAG TPA: hypothetical protein VFU93_05265 [Acidimicrobiales bacterium]|nr:hypothetical protein [Acidimicrobiales bacterium]